MDWDKYSFVISAPTRKNIVLALNREKTPSEITEELKISDSNIPRALRELKKEGIIKLLTPGKKKGRVYMLNKIGTKIRNKITQ